MKVTDYEAVRAEIAAQLDKQGSDLISLIGYENTVLCVFYVYMSNDITKAAGQDFSISLDYGNVDNYTRVSVITTREKVCIITESGMSYYKVDGYLCEYESLSEDISVILMAIQTVLDRIAANNE